jgi:hypothetical protein
VNRARLNYWVDVGIGIAGVMSALTGLALLLPASSTSGILGVSLRLLSSVHTWSSLATVAGVGVHLALHWKWATAMTGQILTATSRQAAAVTATEPEPAVAGGTPLSRRAVLALGGLAAVGVGLAAAGYKAIAQAASSGTVEGSSATRGVGRSNRVACPRGLVNDPYPGQCRQYVDSNGDGICDYSVAGSGSRLRGSFSGEPGGAPPRRHGVWGQP